jgi:hypothetical protein
MSTTMFEDTPIVVGNRPTTYDELRQHALATIEQTNPNTVALAVMVDKDLTPGAIKGSMRVILALLDEIERLTDDNYTADEARVIEEG